MGVTAAMMFGASTNNGVAAQAGDDFCATIQKIVEMAPKEFAPIRGAADGNARDGIQFFDATFNLPGANICDVSLDQQDKVWAYSCSWHIADSASRERQFATFADGIMACFPNAKADRRREGRFSIDSPDISIRRRDSGRLAGLVLTIEQ
ncbi:MAG TPA: hypothetical protein VI485_21520 [Vicinamibacterales bacterium]|nr:hypothetical protein [Vicinamibacterales bacterium]